MICKHTDGPYHDCDYVDWRESLIPVAEEMAYALAPAPKLATDPNYRAWTQKWDAAFHRSMQRLTSTKREAA